MTPYDQLKAGGLDSGARELLGRSHQANWGTKDRLIGLLMRDRGLQFDQCVLVEDDPDEVRRAKSVCRTLLVKEARGMTPEHGDWLLRWASECSQAAAAAPRAPSGLTSTPQGTAPPGA